ncbi:MAG: hypothetical protein V3R16_01400 [Nitrospirales bacterium]
MDDRRKTWEGIRAASLSVLPGVGHLYLGEKRGYWVLAFGLGLVLIWKTLWPPAQILYISVAIFSAVDAFAIAKRGYGLK